MLRLAVVLMLAGFGIAAEAADSVTVEQLRQFLTSKQTSKLADAEVADRLASVTLKEQLTGPSLKNILTQTKLGPKAALQLDLLAEASIFETPPSDEIPTVAAPDGQAQQEMIEEARRYVEVTLHQLPDFLAVRETAGFNDHPETDNAKHSRARSLLHFTGETHREIAFRSGHEMQVGEGDGKDETGPALPGLTTWGEFGPILHVVFGDSTSGGFTWSRWQSMGSGGRSAVFHFAVPEEASHYSITLCCSLASDGNTDTHAVELKPGYHGDLYVDPETGGIQRITLEADLEPGHTLRASGIAVEYEPVDIGGQRFTCPVRGMAISVIQDAQMEAEGGPGELRFVNRVRFLNYHKFGSTARILTGRTAPEN